MTTYHSSGSGSGEPLATPGPEPVPGAVAGCGEAAATAPARFFQMVEMTETCWLWTGCQQGGGYGQFWSGVRQVGAHRWSYEYFIGPITEGLQIDHLCRVRHCVAPFHLEAVTARVNSHRSDAEWKRTAEKTHCKSGHPLSGENLSIDRGYRRCRACHRESERRRRHG